MLPIPKAVAERAATRYEVVGECWLSTYSVGSHNYAQVGWQVGGRNYMTLAHRAAWTHHNGVIPEGMTVDHFDHCNHKCVNPAHLRLLTNSQNARRNRPGLDYPLDWTCPKNHGVPRQGHRCPVCSNEYKRDWARRKREKV